MEQRRRSLLTTIALIGTKSIFVEPYWGVIRSPQNIYYHPDRVLTLVI